VFIIKSILNGRKYNFLLNWKEKKTNFATWNEKKTNFATWNEKKTNFATWNEKTIFVIKK
jgi:hypothetical protein